MSAQHEAWLQQSQHDIEVARHLADAGYHGWACYCAHQAAEKAAKGYYVALNFDYPKGTGKGGHDLEKLIEPMKEFIGGDDPELRAALVNLNQHGLGDGARYPSYSENAFVATFKRYRKNDSHVALQSSARLVDRIARLVVALYGIAAGGAVGVAAQSPRS